MTTTGQFPCVHCGYVYTKGTSTSRSRDGANARRRRECLKCHRGFVTYEVTAADYALIKSVKRWLSHNTVGDGSTCSPLSLANGAAIVAADGDDPSVTENLGN